MRRKHRNRYQRRHLLPDEIANKHKHLKQFNKQLDYEINILNNKVTWIKRQKGRNNTREKVQQIIYE